MVNEKLLKMKDSLLDKLSTVDCIEEVKHALDITETIEISRMLYYEMVILIAKGVSIVNYSSTMTIIKIYDMDNNYFYHYKHSLNKITLEITPLVDGSTNGISTMSGFLNLNTNVKKDFVRFARLNKKDGNVIEKMPESTEQDVFKKLSNHLKREIRTRKIDSLLNKKKD